MTIGRKLLTAFSVFRESGTRGIINVIEQRHISLTYRLRRRRLRIVIGAGGIYDRGWIATDIEDLNLLKAEHWQRLFKPSSIDALLAEHVWEHLSEEDGYKAARQCYEYLKPGGRLRVAVPDGFHPDPKYIDHVKPGGCGPGAHDHKVLYNYLTFSRIFEEAGFRVEPLEYFDANGLFNFVNWQPEDGKIHRSRGFDDRNVVRPLSYTSLILDAWK